MCVRAAALSGCVTLFYPFFRGNTSRKTQDLPVLDPTAIRPGSLSHTRRSASRTQTQNHGCTHKFPGRVAAATAGGRETGTNVR